MKNDAGRVAGGKAGMAEAVVRTQHDIVRPDSMNKWEKSDCRCRPGAKNSKCTICHKPFAMDMGGWAKTTIMVREHSVSSFRGDDVVEFAHPLCIANPSVLRSPLGGDKEQPVVGSLN